VGQRHRPAVVPVDGLGVLPAVAARGRVSKRTKLIAEYGTDVVELMRAIKSAWDPQGILNPGKIFL
jgi:FAD/FMN-containing dehydrogenase